MLFEKCRFIENGRKAPPQAAGSSTARQVAQYAMREMREGERQDALT